MGIVDEHLYLAAALELAGEIFRSIGRLSHVFREVGRNGVRILSCCSKVLDVE
jgi:hypothetical protein